MSQVVNHLLGYSNPVPFDFLIGGTFLRTTLRKFLERNNLTEEPIIELEYVLALGTPETTNSFQHEDWVSAVDKYQNTKDFQMIATGAYDSIIRFWKFNDATSPAFSLQGHTAAIQCIVSRKAGSELFLVSASHDHTLKSWKVNPAKKSGKCVHTMVGHTGSVLSCDVSEGDKSSGLVASGSWDSTIKLWTLKEESEKEEPATKKRKTENEEGTRFKKAAITLLGHKQPVSAVAWTSKDTLASGSWDFSVRYWDVESSINTETKNSNKAVQSLSYSPLSQLTITSHVDNVIRLWDKRTDYTETCQAFISHSTWVSQVAFHPTNPNIFLSASYDMTLKIWDIRSTTPLHTVTTEQGHQQKILTAGWYNDNIFISGGADSLLKTHNIK